LSSVSDDSATTACERCAQRSTWPSNVRADAQAGFVTQGFEVAYAQARETAGEDGIDIAGGASTVRQALAAGVIDELTLDVVPG
jgi:dihydrofolate reductase